MGAGHGHGHGAGTAPTGHAGARHRWRLTIAFCLVAAFFVVELTYGLISNSLALLSDAGHMAADVVALGAALVATRLAARKDETGRRTYGSYRAEIFASGLAVLLMLGVSVYVVIEALIRIGDPANVATGPMLIVGALGLAVNVVSLLLLRGGASESLNVKGAYLEVIADTAGSIGVLVAGWLIAATGDPIWDTAVALTIGVFVAVRAVILGRQVLAVLGQHVPAGVDVDAVTAGLKQLDGVQVSMTSICGLCPLGCTLPRRTSSPQTTRRCPPSWTVLATCCVTTTASPTRRCRSNHERVERVKNSTGNPFLA